MNTIQEAKTEKLDIRKERNRQTYYLTLHQGQRVKIVTQDGSITGELEIRNGALYLMKHKSLKGHTWQGESFGEEVNT